jgi:plasmid maintenance system antidote protein VapI
MKAAQSFHVGEYVTDQLAALGWSVADLAQRMDGDYATNLCAMDLLIHAPHPSVVLGNTMATRLAGVFGTSVELWLNLDKAWHDANPESPITPLRPAPAGVPGGVGE